MKTKTRNSQSHRALAIAVSLIIFAAPVLAQNGNTNIRTNTKIVYHNGPVMPGSSNVYLIWYGNWAGNTATSILTDLVLNLGSSSYFNINALYPDSNGNAPNGGLIYSGTVSDSYSHGAVLTPSDIQSLVRDWIVAAGLPVDSAGIYVVLASADITDTYPDGTTFCTRLFPHHGSFLLNGARVKYGFLGNPQRCPSTAPQFFAPDGTPLATPNDNFGADAMASNLAHLLDVTVTNPLGTGGWYDRYGFENAAKCQGTFGQIYMAPNGGPANIHLGQRDFMLQQNWVNARKGYCAIAAP